MAFRLSCMLTALAVLVAGCASDPADDAGATAGGNETSTGAGAPAPNDDGTKPVEVAAADTGHMPHMHDYWSNRERVTLFDGPIESDAMNATFATVFQVVFGRGVYAGGTLWNLPDGQIVYEGTGAVEITASWSDPRVTGIGFIYRSAESPDYKAGGSLPNGEAFVLPITPMMTDMPHAKVSRWQFGFGPDSSPGAVMGPFNLRVDIVRANDIMVFPAHPDFWQGAHNLTLMDADHSAHVDSYAKRSLQPATQGNFSEDLQKFPKPVPMETKAITFTVNVTSATSTPGEVSHFQLFYHGADSTVLLRCPSKPIASIPGTLTWTVPSTMEMSDSPYSPESQWQFLVEPKVTFGPGLEDVGGMTDVDYSYHVWVMATDLDVSEVEQCSANGG